MHDGTRTAALTAPKQKPRAIARSHGRLNMKCDRTAATPASPNYGATVNNTTVSPLPLNDNSRPPIINMQDKHTCLTQSAHGS